MRFSPLLTTLDLSSNTNISYQKMDYYKIDLDLSQMPSLEKVCVWVLPFPPINMTVDLTGSPNAYFSMDCGK